jgi:hypothetical protein
MDVCQVHNHPYAEGGREAQDSDHFQLVSRISLLRYGTIGL